MRILVTVRTARFPNVRGEPSHGHTLGNMHTNVVKIRRVIPETRSWTDKQTHKQTDRHGHHNTSLRLKYVATKPKTKSEIKINIKLNTLNRLTEFCAQ